MNLGMYKSVIIMGLATLLILLLCIPVIIFINKTNLEIENSRIMIERQYLQRQQLREVVYSLESIRTSTANLNSYAIREGDELEFIQALENIATEHGVEQEINLITANQKVISTWENEVPISITLYGDYVGIINYLRQVESLPYYVQLKTLSLSKSQKRESGSKAETLKAALSGQVSWISNDAPSFVLNDDSL